MKIPQLNPSGRSREYNLYSDELRSDVVKGWLFDGFPHRTLDQEVLRLDSATSKGWQSMGILHYLGMKKDFQGLFSGISSDEAIKLLEADPQDFSQIIKYINPTKKIEPKSSLESLIKTEESEIKLSQKDSSENRLKRIASAKKNPERIRVYSYTYKRNPDIVAEALARASGICERCKNKAPFIRASDNSPYLEVHHVTSLVNGGEDSLENVIAICPNCHREMHFGAIS